MKEKKDLLAYIREGRQMTQREMLNFLFLHRYLPS